MFAKLLCPIDFSPGSRCARRLAERIARECGAELVLAHAGYVPLGFPGGEYPFPPETFATIEERANRGIEDAVREARAAGVKQVSGRFLEGAPWHAIVNELDRQPYDLCVIGTHGRTGLARIVLGSVAEKVVRHAPCSVLAVRLDGDVALPFRHVLVPTDLSASAAHALDIAAKLVSPDGELTVLHVLELPVAWTGEVIPPDLARDLGKRTTTALEHEAARIAPQTAATIGTRSRIGYAGAQILADIDDDKTIDLVVMGSHGRTGIARALVGSVAEKVVRHARGPVLVARKRG